MISFFRQNTIALDNNLYRLIVYSPDMWDSDNFVIIYSNLYTIRFIFLISFFFELLFNNLFYINYYLYKL
jgi:hypothetical protein